MKHKKVSIRDHAAEHLQLGFAGALGIVILLFVFLGNVSVKPVKIEPGTTITRIYPDQLPPVVIPDPPPIKKVVEITKADDDKKADDILPDSNVSFDQPIGDDRIKRTFEDVSIPPVDAKRPELLTKLDVKYPERLRSLEIEGMVIVGAALDEQGVVFDTRILKSSGYEELDSTAIEAVRKARFTPAMQHDKPLAVKVSIPVRFSLRSQ